MLVETITEPGPAAFSECSIAPRRLANVQSYCKQQARMRFLIPHIRPSGRASGMRETTPRPVVIPRRSQVGRVVCTPTSFRMTVYCKSRSPFQSSAFTIMVSILLNPSFVYKGNPAVLASRYAGSFSSMARSRPHCTRAAPTPCLCASR